jgi:Tfp pilus assembly protein PilF
MKNYRSAMKYYNRAYGIALKIGDIARVAEWTANLGMTFLNLKKYALAVDSLDKAIKSSIEIFGPDNPRTRGYSRMRQEAIEAQSKKI